MRLAPTLLAVAALLLGACQTCTEPTAIAPLVAQPLGARCFHEADCAAGLSCLSELCTVPCGPAAPCAVGATCVLGGLCLPSCEGDADCLLGTTAGRCGGAVPPDLSYCFPVPCSSDAACPVGRCAGVSQARGVTWNDTCVTGFCQR